METKCLHITGNQAIMLQRAAREGKFITAVKSHEPQDHFLGNAVGSLDEIEARDLLTWLKVDSAKPLSTLVFDASSRSRTSGMCTTVLTKPLPDGAFLELKDGTDKNSALHIPPDLRIFIDAPPLSLLYAAKYLNERISQGKTSKLEAFYRLVALASEFCGSYARNPLEPYNKRCYFDPPKECRCFVTPKELVRFLDDMPSCEGIALARKAAKYAVGESRSPMETMIFMSWTLPPRAGGFSFPKPLVNQQLVVDDSKQWEFSKHESLRPDFQWPEQRVVGEYLGDEDHASHGARVEDKDRLQDYLSNNYKPFFLMFDDVNTIYALNRTAIMLAKEFAKAGKKFEPYRINRLIKDNKFAARQSTLLKTLLPPITRYD